MGGIFVISLVAAVGVLLASIAVAIPAAQSKHERTPWEAADPPRTTLRSRVNKPFQTFAERSNRQRRRLKAFNSRLPDTLSLLSNAMKAGLSLPQAIESVAHNAAPPISEELARVIREAKLGTAIPAALANMVRRVGSDDLDLIVTAISIQSSIGGNLARILDGISHTIRQRVQIKSQIGAMTAQMRASGWIITLLPFIVAAVLNVITPSYFRLMFTEPAGRVLLVMAGISIFIGNFFVRRITNFRV